MTARERAAVTWTIASLMWMAGALAHAETEGRTDSGISGPPYAEIYESLGRLALKHPETAAVFDYGKSGQGRPLRLIRLLDASAKAPGRRPAVLISGVTHGNEYLHVEDRLPAYFLEERPHGLGRFLAKGGIVYVVPIVNPDGYEAKRRGNARGSDLNRDFDLLPARELNFRESESKALATFLEKELLERDVKLRLAVDYHCCDGSILYPWAHTDQAIASEDLEAHEQVAKLMQQTIDPSYRTGPTGPVLGYNPRGTSKDYYYARYGALAFTFEGSYREEAKKFRAHASFWNQILTQLSGGI